MSEKAAPKLDADKPVMNRWLVVVGAVLIQLCLGAIYAWSVFTPALKASQPNQIVSVYGAGQLGLNELDFKELKTQLTEPTKTLEEIRAKIKGTTDADKKKALKEAEKVVTGKIDVVVKNIVSKENLDKLALGFDNTKTQAIFAAGLAAFAIVMVLAGRLMPKFGPRKLVLAGGVVLGLGYVLGGLLAGKSFMAMLFFIGIIGGAGIGLGYVVPIAVGMKWFPDKKGLVAGLAVAGFGFGALIWVMLAGSWGSLIANLGLPMTFSIYGVAFFLLCAIGSLWMVNPPEGWKPAGWTPHDAKTTGGKAAGMVDMTSGKMLAKPQFYMIFLCFVFGAGAGLMSIGLMKSFPMKAMMSGGMGWKEASVAAGLAMAVFFSLANGLGRIAWGTISDKIGRKLSIIIMMATQGVFVIGFQWMAGTPGLLFVGATLIGFNFGGNFALFPTITADTFGTKYLAQNYGWVFLSYGVGGILGPMLGGRLGDAGNFPLAFTICGVLVLAAAGIIAMVKPPKAIGETASAK